MWFMATAESDSTIKEYTPNYSGVSAKEWRRVGWTWVGGREHRLRTPRSALPVLGTGSYRPPNERMCYATLSTHLKELLTPC
jgi:hypothetical protein